MALHKLAIDFGTTNSVVARFDEDTDEAVIVDLNAISQIDPLGNLPITIPSMLYVLNGQQPEFVIGQQVREQSLDTRKDNRLFRNFKRGIVSTLSNEPRKIDGVEWTDADVGAAFVKHLITALPYADDQIEQLVLTAPVASFEGYLHWLNQVVDQVAPDKVRIIDESTAAALGYMVTEPSAVVLVFDFGGGTLDISLVQLPESREKTGGFLARLRSGRAKQHAAKVIAKAGRIMGGSDVDQWLVQEALKRTNLSSELLGNDYASLLTHCEQAKIKLSSQESVSLQFEAATKSYTVTITRPELEALMESKGFYVALRRVIDKVMHVARQRGIFKEDIHYVLLVGGTSLMPSVQRVLGQYFTDMAVRADKPFTAVAEGALQIAAGYGLEDYLIHSYGLRYLNENGQHDYDEIIPMGSRYPTPSPVEVILEAAHPNQTELELVIGEVDTDSVSMIEVKYEDGQAVFVAQAADNEQQIIAINEADAIKMLAKLDPPGQPGSERLMAAFSVDDRRRLRVTVTDLLTTKTLLDDVSLASLR